MTELVTDYLVVGAGALAMAFVDQLLTETDYEVTIVDRRHLPGGHWVDAYSFVSLHQPSAYYGVGSRRLGGGRIDAAGPNAGFYELATGPEILAYYDVLMRERFLPSGRVRWLPMCDHLGGGRVISRLSGETRQVSYRRKWVDATYSATAVPATHRRGFDVEDGVAIVTPDRLPNAAADHDGYVVLGSGKTAMDACVWLIQAGADPDSISWVRPRDAWLTNRDTVQPGAAFTDLTLAAAVVTLEACADAATADGIFERLEQAGVLLRLDPAVRPTMFRNAIVSRGEVDLLRRVRDVIRLGRVRQVSREAVELDGGAAPVAPGRLLVDCTAPGLSDRAPVPVFDGDRITLQKLRSGYICLSSALTAHVEAAYEDEGEKNAICAGMIAANQAEDWMRVMLTDLEARRRWDQHPELLAWIGAHRLSGRIDEDGEPALPAVDAAALRARIDHLRPLAEMNLARLVAAMQPRAIAPAVVQLA